MQLGSLFFFVFLIDADLSFELDPVRCGMRRGSVDKCGEGGETDPQLILLAIFLVSFNLVGFFSSFFLNSIKFLLLLFKYCC